MWLIEHKAKIKDMWNELLYLLGYHPMQSHCQIDPNCCTLEVRGISGKKQCTHRKLSILYSLGLPCLPYLSCLHAYHGKTGQRGSPTPFKNSINQNEFPPENCHFGGLWKASGRLCGDLERHYVALRPPVRMTVINSTGKATWLLQLHLVLHGCCKKCRIPDKLS